MSRLTQMKHPLVHPYNSVEDLIAQGYKYREPMLYHPETRCTLLGELRYQVEDEDGKAKTFDDFELALAYLKTSKTLRFYAWYHGNLMITPDYWQTDKKRAIGEQQVFNWTKDWPLPPKPPRSDIILHTNLVLDDEGRLVLQRFGV